MHFLNGDVTNIAVIAFLPGHLAAQMPTLSTDVRIGGDYARKLWQKHRLGHQALGLVQIMIDEGWCTKTRENQLDFLYVHGVWGVRRHYVLGIKAAKGGRETWLTTLHPTNESDMRRRIRRAQEKNAVIRGPKWY